MDHKVLRGYLSYDWTAPGIVAATCGNLPESRWWIGFDECRGQNEADYGGSSIDPWQGKDILGARVICLVGWFNNLRHRNQLVTAMGQK